MARTLVLRVSDWRDFDVWRDIELRADQTLGSLHDVIQTAFDLDRDHLYAFFLNNRAWDIAFEYGGPEVTSRFSAEETCLETLPMPVNKRFLYIFDFGDKLTYSVKALAEGLAEAGARYPRIIAAHGEAPPQYEHHDQYTRTEEAPLDPALQELVPLVKKCLEESWRRDAEADRELTGELDGEDAAPDEARVDTAFELDVASRLLDLSETDHDAFHRVERAVEAALVPWLCELPRLLSDGGRNDAALRLHDRLRPLEWESSPSIFDRPVLLARAGQRESALSKLQTNMAEYPDDPQMLLRSGDAYKDLGDLEAAERCWREALKWFGDDPPARIAVRRRLWSLLEPLGRQRDLEELYRAELDFADEMARIRRAHMLGTAYVPPYKRETPKVGRNDPCPCGSGKKFKRCCGSTDL